MASELLTYKELADRLGVKPESARKTVQRKGWKRVQGNDGSTRVMVPEEYLNGHGTGDGDSLSHQVALLEVQIEGLKSLVESERRRADAAESDRDAWRTHAQTQTQPAPPAQPVGLLRRIFG